MPETQTKTPDQYQFSNKKSYELPPIITRSMRFLQFFSHRLALRFALKLFFTTLKFKIPEREKPVYNLARRKWNKTDKGVEFEQFEWGEPGNETILLVHGWSGRGTQFFQLIEALLEKGYHVISFDAPAHGNSKLKQTNLLEFTDCIRSLNSDYGPFNKAVGHSLGGAAIFNSINLGVPITSVITIGTPVSIKSVVKDFCDKVCAGEKVGFGIINSIENTFQVKTDEISNDYLATKYQPKGLIIHDTEDLDVGVHNAYELNEKWPGSELVITSGLGHRRVLNDSDLIQKMLSFISESD